MANIDSVKLPNGTSYNVKDVTAQPATLVTPLTIDGVIRPTVEGALGGLNTRVFSNPNLLINPWFTVNQRGFTSGTYSTKTYIVDRWCTNRSTIALVSGGLSLAKASGTDGWIRQYLENDYAGETITISLIVDGVIYSSSGIGSFNFAPTANIYVEWDESLKMLHIENKSTTAVTIRAVKLEIGSTSTLHLDTAPDYTTELLKCQRYFVRIQGTDANTGYSSCFATSGTNARVFIPMTVPMRAIPTMTYSGTFNILMSGSSNAVSAINLMATQIDNLYHFSLTSSGLTTGYSGLFYSSGASDYIDLSAEL